MSIENLAGSMQAMSDDGSHNVSPTCKCVWQACIFPAKRIGTWYIHPLTRRALPGTDRSNWYTATGHCYRHWQCTLVLVQPACHCYRHRPTDGEIQLAETNRWLPLHALSMGNHSSWQWKCLPTLSMWIITNYSTDAILSQNMHFT